MNKIETFQQFLATNTPDILWGNFLINLILVAILSWLLGKFYVRYGQGVSNRQIFARNFLLLGMTTMFIIAIVKSSLALSLGLVGALSIVRFRAAIKEPEELAYLFLVIGLGLGFGADQRLLTLLAFAIVILVLWIANRQPASIVHDNLYLTLSGSKSFDLNQIVQILQDNCAGVDLKRFDQSGEQIEASFVVVLADFKKFQQVRTKIQKLDPQIEIHFLDNKGLC